MFRSLLAVIVLVVSPAVAMAQQPCTTDARHVVDELYRHMLERSADPGSAGWVEQLQNRSATVRDIVRAIAKSPEHAQRFYNPGEGTVAHERAVGALYRHILGRQPDDAGQREFARIASNNGLGPVVDAIVNSDEYDRSFGDWGVPGSGGLQYCGSGVTSQTNSNQTSSNQTRFSQLDTNQDGVIQRREWRGTTRSFNIRDWNGDGVLSGDEVRYNATVPSASLESRDYDMTFEDRFTYLDYNNNSTIERNEWDGSLDTFYRLDLNRDGRLTRAEMRSIVGNRFAAVDTNRDGRITLGEWPYSHRSFDDMDVNGDGVIVPSEFRGGSLGTARR